MRSQSADWRRLRIMFEKQIDMIEALRQDVIRQM
nr:MAG TPA: hypothetical protein [Caudoviricetes sp.]